MVFFDFRNAKFALVCLIFMNFCFMLLRNLLIREFREVHVDFVLCKFVLLCFCVWINICTQSVCQNVKTRPFMSSAQNTHSHTLSRE
jgi:fatty-acid desaturase